jgi:NMD protein affecting ribosome stability and mRNA decay
MIDAEQFLQYLELCNNIKNNLNKKIIYYQENPQELTSDISNSIHQKVELLIRTEQGLKEKKLQQELEIELEVKKGADDLIQLKLIPLKD